VLRRAKGVHVTGQRIKRESTLVNTFDRLDVTLDYR
jgi:hypothetical protein